MGRGGSCFSVEPTREEIKWERALCDIRSWLSIKLNIRLKSNQKCIYDIHARTSSPAKSSSTKGIPRYLSGMLDTDSADLGSSPLYWTEDDENSCLCLLSFILSNFWTVWYDYWLFWASPAGFWWKTTANIYVSFKNCKTENSSYSLFSKRIFFDSIKFFASSHLEYVIFHIFCWQDLPAVFNEVAPTQLSFTANRPCWRHEIYKLSSSLIKRHALQKFNLSLISSIN